MAARNEYGYFDINGDCEFFESYQEMIDSINDIIEDEENNHIFPIHFDKEDFMPFKILHWEKEEN